MHLKAIALIIRPHNALPRSLASARLNASDAIVTRFATAIQLRSLYRAKLLTLPVGSAWSSNP